MVNTMGWFRCKASQRSELSTTRHKSMCRRATQHEVAMASICQKVVSSTSSTVLCSAPCVSRWRANAANFVQPAQRAAAVVPSARYIYERSICLPLQCSTCSFYYHSGTSETLVEETPHNSLRSHHASFLPQDRCACKDLSAASYYRLIQEDG
jgi:hypothetical protein